MRAVTIAANDLRRMMRWRANLFFLFVLPMLLILLLGATFGGAQKARIGVLNRDGGALARQFTTALGSRASTQLIRYGSYATLQKAVARGDVDAGLVIPATYDALLQQGATATLGYFARPDSVAQQLRPTLQSVAADQSRVLAAAQALQQQLKLPFDRALARASAVATRTPRVRVLTTAPDGSAYSVTAGRFQQGASTMLVLFIFFTSVVTGAGFMIETRRLGIARRVLSTPTSSREIVAGQLLGGLAVALTQALIIVFGSMLFFGVVWGNALGAAAVILSFCLVGTGMAVLLGSTFASEDQARPVGFLLGLGLAALGGSMAPLEIFPSTARTIAHITPHAWANDAFSKLLDHGGDLITVLPQIGVLIGFAALATTAAVWRLQRTLTGRAHG